MIYLSLILSKYFIDAVSEIHTICVCPHDGRYLLVGGSDGIIRLHSKSSTKPLTSWQVAKELAPIIKINWSPSRPCVFYVLDDIGRSVAIFTTINLKICLKNKLSVIYTLYVVKLFKKHNSFSFFINKNNINTFASECHLMEE